MKIQNAIELTTEDQSLNSIEKSLLIHFIGVANPKIILELGVYKGSTTKFINEFLNVNNIKSKIIGFDLEDVIIQLTEEDPLIKEMVKKNRLELIGGLLPFTLKKYLKQNKPTIDCVLIDAKHDYKSVFGELTLIWPYLSKDGFIICHDYHKTRLQYAMRYFSKKNNARFIPILNTSDNSNFQSSLAVFTKSKLKYNFFMWCYFHFDINKIRGYYFFKKLLKKIKII